MHETDREKDDCHRLQLLDYAHPGEVLQDDRLSLAQKRTILCAWASGACAVDSRPGFRWLPGTPGPILVDHILATLRALEDLAGTSREKSGGMMAEGDFLPRPANAEGGSVYSI